MKGKKGISLIVLVITIIVIVVLAVAVIVSLANNNPVENSKEATFKNDVASIKDAMNLVSADILLGKIEDEDKAYNDLIPEKYKDILYIENGVLYYTGEDAQEEEWARQIDVIRGEKLPTDWIDISKSSPENGLSLLIGKPETSSATIKFKVDSTGGYKVDWGDGSSNSYASEVEAIHTYSTNSDKSSTDGYLFEVNITPDGGEITRFQHTQTNHSPLLWFQVGCDTLTDCEIMFYNANNLKRFGTAKETSLSQVKNMWGMFTECSSLTSIPYFDTSNVTDMGDMFYNCSSLTSIPKLNTSQITRTDGMFSGCSSLKTIPQLDTGNVKYMSTMFNGCSSLKSIPNLDTSQVTDMSYMFSGCSSLTSVPKLDTNQVINMDYMFIGCSSLTSVPDLDMSKVEAMEAMFRACSSLTIIPKLNTSKVTSMPETFLDCSSLEEISYFDTSQVTYMDAIFLNCNNLKSINISNTNLTNEQINNVFVELPESTNNPVIDITGNPGESSCTRVTATEKGWTVKP